MPISCLSSRAEMGFVVPRSRPLSALARQLIGYTG